MFLKIDFKKSLLILLDSLAIYFSIKISEFLILNNTNKSFADDFNYILISILIFISVFYLTGQYKSITRYLSSKEIYNIFIRCLGSQFFIFLTLKIVNNELPNLKLFLISTILVFLLISGPRSVFRDFIYKIKGNKIKKRKTYKIGIYGAGEAGSMLLASLENSKNYKVKYFFDDNNSKSGRFINGVRVVGTKNINKYINSLDKIFLAIPSLNQKGKRNIIKNLSQYKIEVLQIPSIEEISSGNINVNNLRKINIKDLLDRKVIEINSDSNEILFKNKTILVTGAGGSIGKELCNQILKSNPKKIILLDNSEPNLYFANKFLRENFLGEENKIIPILGDASDAKLIDRIFCSELISVVFHSAAYKHVPLVELNPIQGLKNNIFSTYVISSKAIEYKVDQMILISSDKAVRPTNIMGASKRFSELIIQAFDYEINKKNRENNTNFINTKLSMVRFGNVLDSSGSVVPLFKDQIANGGPITLTHKDIIRYFMTIEEATQLVLQAASLSNGGDLFLLDMGNPVKIIDLAKQMIFLSGLTLKDKSNPSGDIEILTTGLRPGEKLYEELLIDAKSMKTIHPHIFRAKEKFITPEILWPKLKELEKLLNQYEKEKSFEIISELVPDWDRRNK